MSSNKFSRFLHLERARGDKTPPGGQVRLQDGGRFESVAGPGEVEVPASEAVPEAHVERFKLHGQAPLTPEVPASVSVPEAHVERFKLHGQTPLALDDAPARGQHFPRCVRCQAENGRFAQACTTCGADLHSPEQLAYDEERARAREQAELQTRAQMNAVQNARQETQAEQLAERQRYTEQLRQAFEKERSLTRRLEPLFTPSLGVGLLRLIPQPLARWSTLAWAIGLPILLVRFGNEPLRVLGLYLGAAVCVSFVPTSLWTAGRGGRW